MLKIKQKKTHSPGYFPEEINFPTLMGSDILGGWVFVVDVTREEGGRGKDSQDNGIARFQS